MPIYDYKCGACGFRFEETKRIADREQPLHEPCPKCELTSTVEMVLSFPNFIANHKLMSARKPDGGFREVMSKIHETTPGSDLKDLVNYPI